MGKPKLCQVVAVEKGVKSRCYGEFTTIHQKLQKPILITGLVKTYQPKDDDGDKLPGESTKVQLRVEECLKRVGVLLGEWFDVTATKDWANCTAFADVVVDGKVLLTKVPVTYLMFLEKQLTDLHTFVKGLPTLDPAHDWHFDGNQNCAATQPIQTTRTTKEKIVMELAKATDKHPAQVQLVDKDLLAGYWTTTHYSGALTMERATTILSKVERLQQAVKFAREEANSIEVVTQKVGEPVFNFLFGE